MTIPQTRKCQRGLGAWTMIGSLLVVAGIAGFGVAMIKPGSLTKANVTRPQQTQREASAPVAAQQLRSPDTLSSGAFGAAKFGMRADSVERALGKRLVLDADGRKNGVADVQCGTVGVEGLPGVELHFNQGRLAAGSLTKPGIMTQSGFAVGDPESKVIAAFRNDPSYMRTMNRHADPSDKNAPMEITLGQPRTNPRTGQPTGPAVHIVSEGGRVKLISAGDAGYVLVDEQDGSCW